MRKIKFIIVFLVFFIFINVKAIDSCTNEELGRLKELANNVEIKYEYELKEYETEYIDESGNSIIDIMANYKLNIINDSSDLKYIYTIGDNKYQYDSNEDSLTSIELSQGDNLNISIVAYSNNLCSGKVLKSMSITLPYYNKYSKNEECLNYPDFKYCKELLDDYITEEVFQKELNKYKKSPDNNSDPISINKVISLTYIYYFMGGFVVIVIIVIISLSIKKRRKEKL